MKMKWCIYPGAALLAACVQLSPAGARVQVLTAADADRVAQCRRVSAVSVSSVDAVKNAAAEQGADVAVMSPRDVAGMRIFEAKLYQCAANAPAPELKQPVVEPAPTKLDDEVLKQKTARCQAKGGNWINGQCVITLE